PPSTIVSPPSRFFTWTHNHPDRLLRRKSKSQSARSSRLPLQSQGNLALLWVAMAAGCSGSRLPSQLAAVVVMPNLRAAHWRCQEAKTGAGRLTSGLEWTRGGAFCFQLHALGPAPLRPSVSPHDMEVSLNANMCDQATQRIAKILRDAFETIEKDLSKAYGGTIQHLWIDFELIQSHAEGRRPFPFRFQKRVGGSISKLTGLPTPVCENVGHYRVR